MTFTEAPHRSVEDRRSVGREARRRSPRSSHADWPSPPASRDAVALVEGQNDDRLSWLVPIRRARMLASPFAFYRGAAKVMAADLATTPTSGLTVQACGDAHLSNFGMYASPERELVIDVNDFDETIAGPWEWDVKRMAASFMISAEQSGFDRVVGKQVTGLSVASYRTAMADFAARRTLDIWYDHLPLSQLQRVDPTATKATRQQQARLEAKAQRRDSLSALASLAIEVDGKYRIRNEAPLLVPYRDLEPDIQAQLPVQLVYDVLNQYSTTLPDDRRQLLSRFQPVDVAIKVVGVGSVGTRCFIMLLEGRDRDDPMFLQVKEASHSVLEEHLTPSPYENQGQRVVEGQRLMQAESDIFLGWIRGPERDYYVRQLRDWKLSVDPERATPEQAGRYARVCGWTLARAHARSGDPIAISAYLGSSDAFDRAVTTFSVAYAKQNRRDHRAFADAVKDRKLAVERA